MNKSLVELRKYNQEWCPIGTRSPTLCVSEFEKQVKLPARVNKITLVFTDKRMADSFKLRKNYGRDSTANPYKVGGISNLTYQADYLIRDNMRAGRGYVRVEYV